MRTLDKPTLPGRLPCPVLTVPGLSGPAELALCNLQKIIAQFHLQMFNRFRFQTQACNFNPVGKPASSSPGNGENLWKLTDCTFYFFLFLFLFFCLSPSFAHFIYLLQSSVSATLASHNTLHTDGAVKAGSRALLVCHKKRKKSPWQA